MDITTYKLKQHLKTLGKCSLPVMFLAIAACDSDGSLPSDINISLDTDPVSYTHLTLPTKA